MLAPLPEEATADQKADASALSAVTASASMLGRSSVRVAPGSSADHARADVRSRISGVASMVSSS
jgi:hypothetical protein